MKGTLFGRIQQVTMAEARYAADHPDDDGDIDR